MVMSTKSMMSVCSTMRAITIATFRVAVEMLDETDKSAQEDEFADVTKDATI